MAEETPMDPAQYLLEVEDTLQGISQFLERQKKMGNTQVKISDESRAILSRLSGEAPRTRQTSQDRFRSRAPEPQSRPRTGPPQGRPETPLKTQGPETASVYFVDGENDFLSGQAGALLGKIITAMGLDPQSVFLCNTANRPGLMAKIKANSPRFIISLGEDATRFLLQTRGDISKYQGRFTFLANARIMPTRHPRELLQNPGLKRQVWENMKIVMAAMEGGDHGG